MTTKLTDDQVIDLVKEAGLDWHAGFGLNEENRYGALVELAFNLGRAPSQQAVAVGDIAETRSVLTRTAKRLREGNEAMHATVFNEFRLPMVTAAAILEGILATSPAATARVGLSEAVEICNRLLHNDDQEMPEDWTAPMARDYAYQRVRDEIRGIPVHADKGETEC